MALATGRQEPPGRYIGWNNPGTLRNNTNSSTCSLWQGLRCIWRGICCNVYPVGMESRQNYPGQIRHYRRHSLPGWCIHNHVLAKADITIKSFITN